MRMPRHFSRAQRMRLRSARVTYCVAERTCSGAVGLLVFSDNPVAGAETSGFIAVIGCRGDVGGTGQNERGGVVGYG